MAHGVFLNIIEGGAGGSIKKIAATKKYSFNMELT
jgi:hypothetical protein